MYPSSYFFFSLHKHKITDDYGLIIFSYHCLFFHLRRRSGFDQNKIMLSKYFKKAVKHNVYICIVLIS
jgi:hypothetical protein